MLPTIEARSDGGNEENTVKVKRIPKKELEARIVRTKIVDPAARIAALDKAIAKVRAKARIDFVRSLRS